MPNELKIVIDADVSKGITGMQTFGKVFTGEFNKIINSASNVDKAISASIQKINASLSSLKVSSLDVNVDTSQIDGAVQNIRTKFSALVDPEINILANSAQAETAIRDLVGELTALKDSEVFIRANDSQALQVINEVESELNGLLDKQIKLNINSADATQKLNLLEKELADLQNLVLDPKISTNQLRLFQTNIERLKAEIASLKTQGVVIPIGVDTVGSQAKLNTLSETIETIRGKIEARKFSITVETDIRKIAAYNKEIEELEARMRQIQNVGKRGFELFVVPGQTIQSVKTLSDSVARFGGGVKTFIPPAIQGFTKLNTSVHPVIGTLKNLEKQSKASGDAIGSAFTKSFAGLRSLAALIPGIGLGGLIGIAASAVNSLTQGFFDAAFGAKKLSDNVLAVKGALEQTGSESARLQGLVSIAKDVTVSTRDRKLAIDELQKSYPGYLENISLENINSKAAKKSIDELTESILNKAVADQFATLVAQKELQIFEKIQKIKTLAGRVTSAPDQTSERLARTGLRVENERLSKLIEQRDELRQQFKDAQISAFDLFKEDPNKQKQELDKQRSELERFINETIARAKQFAKEFGGAFVVPDLEESFFKTKQQVFEESKKLLSDIDSFLKGNLKALQLKVPIQVQFSQAKEDVTKNVTELNKIIASLKGNDVAINVTTQGIDEVKKTLSDLKDKTITVSLKQLGEIDLSDLKDKEIAIKISQTGDVKKIAEQLTKLKGVEIPIVIEQKGNVEKIAEELTKLKGQTIPIKITQDGNIKDIAEQLRSIKDVKVNISATQNIDEALKSIDTLIKGKQFPIIIDQGGIITQISKAVDGAIKVVKIKKIVVPVVVEADFLPIPTEGVSKEIIDSFFKDIESERKIPIKVIPDVTIDKSSIEAINKKLDLRGQFSILGDLGLKEFNKLFKDIDTNNFAQLSKGIEDATLKLQNMFAVAQTLNQAVGQGMVNAFNAVFDAVLEGKNVFKALAEGIKQLIVGTIKAIAQMLILRAVSSFFLPGLPAGGGGLNLPKGQYVLGANFGQLTGIGSRAFQNVLNINVNGQISGDVIRLAGQRAAGSQGRFG